MQHKNERGMSLVELLAAIVLSAIIGAVGYSLLFSGFSTYDRVKVESELRDEADLIMTSFINELFTLNSGEIVNENGEVTELSTSSYLQLKDGTKIGFENKQPIVRDRIIHLSDDIRVKDGTKIKKIRENQNTISYEIILELEFVEGKQTLETKSEIGIINNPHVEG